MVLIQFYKFELDPGDYLDIYNGTSERSPKIGRYSGRIGVPDIKSTGPIFLYFESNREFTAAGFGCTIQGVDYERYYEDGELVLNFFFQLLHFMA